MAKRTQRPGFDASGNGPAPSSSGLGDLSRRRNRPGRTGLDPMDTYREVGYAEGMFLKHILTLRLRTRNPLVLIAMSVVGLALLPLLTTLGQIKNSDELIFSIMCMAPLGVFGALLLLNVGLSVFGVPVVKHNDDDPFTEVVTFDHTGDAEMPYHATVDDAVWTICLNNFPDEPLYTLLIDGEAEVDFDDWPPTWTKPVSDD